MINVNILKKVLTAIRVKIFKRIRTTEKQSKRLAGLALFSTTGVAVMKWEHGYIDEKVTERRKDTEIFFMGTR